MGVDDWLTARFKPWQVVAGAVVLLACALAFAAWVMPAGADYDDEARECREQVESRLRSPATADFGEQTITTRGQATYVSGAVDSENGFGANVRSDYRCEVRGDEVRVVNLATR